MQMVMNPLKEGQSRTATDEEQAKAHVRVFTCCSYQFPTLCSWWPAPCTTSYYRGSGYAGQLSELVWETSLFTLFNYRTKDIIKDQLPRKLDNVVFCPLTPKQIKVYKRVLALPAVDNMIRKDELCDCGSKEV
jgi:hypothetical protein